MRYLVAMCIALSICCAARAGAPPQHPDVPPAIVQTPPTANPGGTGSKGGSGGGNGPTITSATPEPATLTIALVSAAAAGSYRLLRKKS